MADAKPVKAQLRELKSDGTTEVPNSAVPVQINPETLKVSYTSTLKQAENTGTNKNGTSAVQFLSQGTTKLSVQLWFDVTAVLPPAQARVNDVRMLTQKIAYFMQAKAADNDPNTYVPPSVRFVWGTFQFDGLMESMEESLEFFSPDGRPLRASVTISLMKQSIQFAFAKGGGQSPGGTPPPGTAPLTSAPAGSSLGNLVAAAGASADWHAVAQANGIENPRLLQPGQLINLNASVSAGASASVSLGS
jgi:hypothetical protein